MTDERYLLDNNVLRNLTKAQCASSFFRNHCSVPSEVLYEARGRRDSLSLSVVEYPTTKDVLEQLKLVMAALPPDDTKLVSLFRSKGAADPMLIACALDGIEKSKAALWRTTWVVVSNDNAVRSHAANLGVEACDGREFQSRTADLW